MSKVKHQEADTIFLKKHIKEVKKDYINNRDTLVEFFTNYGFDKELNFQNHPSAGLFQII